MAKAPVFNRAKTLVDAAHDSVGKSGGQGGSHGDSDVAGRL